MAIPRASANLGRTVLRRASAQTRSQAWKRIGRRQYASEHGGASQSSELPWIIGSVGLTVPAAVWLFGQGPKKSDHGHEGHGESHEENADKEEHEPASEEKDQDQPNSEKEYSGEGEPQQEEKEEAASDSDDSKAESEDKGSDDSSDEKAEKDDKDSKDEKSGKDEKEGGDEKSEKDEKPKQEEGDDSGPKKSEDGYELPGPNAPGQINYRSGLGKGPGEGSKGGRPRTEKKGEKDSAKDFSGAQNPYLSDAEKSKKGEGVKDTAKIHGTVDSNRPLSGPKSDSGVRGFANEDKSNFRGTEGSNN